MHALEAAALHPAQALSLASSKGSLHPGADADIILLDEELQVDACYVGGELAWSRDEGFVSGGEEGVAAEGGGGEGSGRSGKGAKRKARS